MQQCYNRGCGQKYNPEQNSDDSCRHHPGEPYFHDAYKGWSCCKKKSVDFTEFLSIKGCTLSKHSNVKPPEAEKPLKSSTEEVVVVREPISEPMKRPAIETPMVAVTATVMPSLKEAIDSRRVTAPAAVASPQAASSEISVGTACKNSGCTFSYTGTAADYNECQHHPGVPIFHEGMKYWSCCQKKTSDFSVFMAQKGCVNGTHKWVKQNEDKRAVQCRYDWHQTAANVTVSIYAKMYHYSESIIEINPIRLHVNLVFPNQENASYDLDMELRGVVDVSKTTALMGASKVEITMPKAEPGSWPKLDFPNTKLPPLRKSTTIGAESQEHRKQDSDSEDDFNLDDIETVNTGFRLAEITPNNKNGLD